MARWISTEQQRRDHAGLRESCAACGVEGTTRNPLVLDDEGYRVHRSHITDPESGLYQRGQE